jgi:hypothetical protein
MGINSDSHPGETPEQEPTKGRDAQDEREAQEENSVEHEDDGDNPNSENTEKLLKSLQAERKLRKDMEKKLKAMEREKSKAESPERQQQQTDNWREIVDRKTREAEEAADRAAKAEKELADYRMQSSLSEKARQYVRDDALQDIVRLHSGNFEIDDKGNVETADGVTPDEYFSALVKKQPFYAREDTHKGFGIQGKGSKGSKTVSIKRHELRAMSPSKRAAVLKQVEDGKAVIED